MDNKKLKISQFIIAFIILFGMILGLLFIDLYSIRFKDNGVTTYLNLNMFNLLKDSTYEIIFNQSDGILSFPLFLNFDILSYIVLILLILGFVIFSVNLLINHEFTNKILNIISIILYLLSLVFFILIPLLFSYIHSLNNLETFKDVSVNQFIFILYIILIVILTLFPISYLNTNSKLFSINDIVELSIMVALALILDKIKISIGSTGGSINLSALPLIIFSIRKGFIKGLFASSIVFAFISNIFDGYGLVCLPFDYVIAFSGYAFSGLFYSLFKKYMINDKKTLLFLNLSMILGCLVSFITRMFGSSLSSIFLYEYSVKAALIYNLAYISLSILSSLIGCILLSYPLMNINKKYK